jgi:filamentous hemagglutinin family protein
VSSRAHVGACWRWNGTLGFFLGLQLMVVSAGAAAQAIRPDGRTQTSVTTTGAVTSVTTATVSGANAFNSFSSFNVPASNTTNLYLPTGTANLINIVRDQRTNIDGILNAIKDGRIGGNVWFANPNGFIVGAGGVVNVGSLNVSTPSQQFVDNFFLSPGSPDDALVAQLLSGAAPRNAAGLISIQGRVNAIDSINLSAGVINVGGTLFAGARFLGNAPDFTDVVNVNGIDSATNFITQGGRIQIVADGDVTVSGAIAAPGAAGVRGGDISIHAGGNVDLQSGALISARGNGDNSAGGTISILADGDATIRSGAWVDASAGSSGDGGFVEFSASNNVTLAGGQMIAEAPQGAAGTVLIDPTNLTGSGSDYFSATNYVLSASDSITLSNVVIATRNVAAGDRNRTNIETAVSTGNSGSITLTAPNITLTGGTRLLAEADSGFTGGAVTLTASQTNSLDLGGFRSAAASIQIGDASGSATIRGDTVNVNASTTVDTRFFYDNPAGIVSSSTAFADTIALGATTFATDLGPTFAASLLGINLVHSESTGSSSVVVKGGSVIEGKQSVSLTAVNSVGAGAMTAAAASPGAQVDTPLGLGALYARVQADATVDIQSGATVKGGNLTVLAHNDASLQAKIKGGSDSSSSDVLSIAFGVAMANVNATATLEQGAIIKSTGDISVAATNSNDFENKVEAVTGPNGKIAAAVGYTELHTNATAQILSNVADARTVQVVAVDHTLENSTEVSTSTGVTNVDQIVTQAKQLTVVGLEEALWAKLGLSVQKIDEKASPQATPFRIGGAIAYVDSNNSATALIGDGANVHATTSVAVVARTIDEGINISADSAVTSSSSSTPATGTTGSPSRVNVSMGLTLGSYEHDALAEVGKNAVITAPEIAVSSDTSIPIKPTLLVGGTGAYSFDRWDGLSTFAEAADSLNFLDVVNGESSSKVKGSDSPTSIGFSGSANIINFTNNSSAVLDAGATLNLTGSATGSWSLPAFTVKGATSDTTLGGVLLFVGKPADVQTWDFDAPAQVRATHDATLIFQAGKTIAPADSGSQKAIGMGLSQIGVDSTVEAIVREGAVIRGLTETASAADADGVHTYSAPVAKATDDVRVTANSSDQIISFGANAGTAGGGGNAIGINGTISIVNINNTTLASVDNEASITARNLAITSTENAVSWSIGGAFNLSSSTAVGIGLAINDVTTNTRAEIADNDTDAVAGVAQTSQLNVTTGAVNVRDIDVEGRTGGRVEAIAVTGAVSNAGNPANPPGAFDKVKAAYNSAIAGIGSLVGMGGGSASQQSSQASPPPKPPPPTFGLSGAGSGAINLTDMTTNAVVDGATLNMTPAGTTGTAALTVRAVSDSDITTASGAAALTRANNPNQTSAAAMDGSVAVNMVGNGTEALIRNSTVTGVHNVDVQALTGGEQLSVAIGAAVNATSNPNADNSKAVTGSLSLTLSQVDANGDTETYAKARIENSTVTGDSTTTGGNLNVTAYNHTMIGTGGGALAFGGKTGFGGAVTYSDIRNDVIAEVSSSTISQFDTVAVHATNATEIGAGAADGGISTRNDGSAIGGAFVLTSVENHTSALIDSLSSVTATTKVDVLATDSSPDSTLQSIIDPSNKRANTVSDFDYCGRSSGVGAAAGGNCITSVAGVVQINTGSNSSNLGISYVQSLISNSLTANISDSVVKTTGASGLISVKADSSANILGLALGVGGATKFSGAGSVSVGQIDNTINASVSAPAANASYKTLTANDITIQAQDNSTIQTVGGQVAISSGQNALGAAITYNDISNEAHALVDGVTLNVADQARLDSENHSTIQSLAVAGGLASGSAITASVSVNFIGNTTDAKVNNATLSDNVASDTNTVSMTALDASAIDSLAGSVSIGKNAGVGGAFAYNKIDNTTLASIDSSLIQDAVTIAMTSQEGATIRSLSAAAAGSGGSSLAGSLSLNEIGNNTTADLISTGITGFTADVGVSALDTSTIKSASGGAAIALGGSGAGIAASINRIGSTTDAHVTGAATDDYDVNSLTLTSHSTDTISTISVALGAAANVGVGGSAASSIISNSTTAYITGGAKVTADDNVGVFAQNDDSISVIAGALGGSFGAVGAGISVVVNLMGGTTDAHISGSTTEVDARGHGAAMAVNTGKLVTPINVNSVLTPTTVTPDMTEVTTTVKGLAVTATSHQAVIADAATVGVSAGVGVSLVPVTNIMGGTTQAFIDSSKIDTHLADFSAPQVYVNAGSQAYAGNFVIGAAGGTLGATGAASGNNMDRSTYSYITNATVGNFVTQTSSTRVTDTSTQLGGASGSTIGDIDPNGPSTTTVTNTDTVTKTLLPTVGAVNVKATASQNAADIVAGFAAGIGAVAGTGIVNIFGADTEAHVDQGSVKASSLAVGADSTSGFNAVAGAGAVGGTGGAGAFVVGVSNSTTKAWVGDVNATTNTTLLSLSGALSAVANTTDNFNSIVASGAVGGGAGIAGMADVAVINNTTTAGLYHVAAGDVAPQATPGTSTSTSTGTSGTAPAINTTTTTTNTTTFDRTTGGKIGVAMGDVSVGAAENVNLAAKAGALGGGGGTGVGAGANIAILKSQVTGEIVGGSITTPGNVGVAASSTKNLDLLTATAGVGGTAGIGGSAGVILVGSGSTGTAGNEVDKGNNGTLTSVNAFSSNAQPANSASGLSTTEKNSLASGSTYAVSGVLTSATPDAVTASISGASLNAATVNVAATGVTGTKNVVGAGGAGTVGIGGAVGFTRVYDNINAQIIQSTVTTPSLTVAALMQDGSNPASKVTAYAGGAGIVGLGAAVADALVQNTVTASIGGTLTGDGSNTAGVSARDTSSIDADGIGAAVGAAAIGIVVTNASKSSTVTASTLASSNITQYQTINIKAADSGAVSASATAAAGGLLSGAGATGLASDTAAVTAQVGGGTVTAGSGGLNLTATDTPNVDAQGIGVSVGALSVGASVATATAAPTVSAKIADSTNLTGSGAVSVLASSDVPDGDTAANANTMAGAGGTLVGANASVSTASDNATVTASIGNNVTLTSADISIAAVNNSNQTASTTGVGLGWYAAGANTAVANANGSTTASLGTGATGSRAGKLDILATGTDQNFSGAMAGTGGVVAGNAATATTSDTSTTTAKILGTGTRATLSGSDISVIAQHTDNYGESADSVNAAVAGASGAIAIHTATSTVLADIGQNVTLNAGGSVVVGAANSFISINSGDSASAAAGGVVNASAAVSTTTITGNTTANLGSGVIVSSGTDRILNPGGIELSASSYMKTSDQVTLTTGGAIQGAGTNSSITATLNNAANIGASDQLFSPGNIGAGTYTFTQVGTSSLVSTWGLAAIGVADATTDITTNQSVAVGTGATLQAFGNVNLTPGLDPLGFNSTSLSGSSSAQGYVRGVIAVPDADATTNLAGNSSLNIGSGSQIKSGQNTTIGAYNGTPLATADGTGHGYELGFIPVTDGSSHTSTPTTASVVVDGTVTAGVFHDLAITISGNTLTSNADGAPFLYNYNPSFDAQGFVAQNYTGTQAQLLNTGVSSSTVGAFTLGTLFASGGTITINADTLSGNGTLTAFGAPTISVINSSSNYLVLGPVNIPNLPGGKLIFTGAAGLAQLGGITPNENGATGSSSVIVSNTFNGSVGNVSYGPALLLTNTVENLGGLIQLNNTSGSLGQSAEILGQQVQVNVPNGVAVISIPTGVSYAGGNPYSEWQNYMIWPGGNPADGVPNAATAITYVANAEFNPNGTITDNGTLTRSMIGSAGTVANTSKVYFGACGPFAGLGDCSAGGADRLSPIGQHLDLTNSGGSSFPMMPVQTLTKTAASYSSADLSGSQASTVIYGGQVSINAQFIDINGKISAGQPTNWSLSLPTSLMAPVVFGQVQTGFTFSFAGGFPILTPVFTTQVVGGGALAYDAYLYNSKQVANPVFSVPLATTRAGDQPITASYDASTNQITVDKVSASSGGGLVSLTGKILSTNTLGQIHVNGGLGDVAIDNQTGASVVLNNINAGNTALAAGLSSKVEITDLLNPDTGHNHTAYVYSPATGMAVYNGSQSTSLAALIAGTPVSTSMTAETTFNPQAGLRWQWQEQASLSRSVSGDYHNWTYGDWNWDTVNGQPNNPWRYVVGSTNANGTLSSGSTLQNTPIGKLLTGQSTALPVFVETVTGSSSNNAQAFINYHGCGGSIGSGCNYGFRQNGTSPDQGQWVYNFPRNAVITQTMSVKADNPFKIDFSGNATGSIVVNSNAAVSINGTITNPNGGTSVTSTGSITETPTGSILTKNLTLSAGSGGIGTADSPDTAFKATLTANGVLNVQNGDSSGVYLKLNSGALLGLIASGNSTAGYGDVVINASNDLASALGAGAVNVTGRNITLNSDLGGVGSEATPVVLAARTTSLPSGAISGGVVDVSALNNIGITQSGGDLLIGKIESTAGGDVYINVPNGTIFGAAGQTAAQALSDTQVRKIWQDLHLTAALGAESGHATDASVVAFQNQVNSNYQQYWRLLGNGSVSGGVFALSTASLALYRPLAAAALGITSPTDTQVQSYANSQYQNVVTSLNNLVTPLGTTATAVLGTSFNSSFSFHASTPEITALTKNAVWQEGELSYAISKAALQPSSGTVGIGNPNIVGRDIKLVTQGAIGKLAAPVSITLADLTAGTLTTGQAAALALAIAPGDVVAVDASGHPVDASLVTPTAFQISQTAPVFVDASGKLTATAAGVTYLQSTGQTLSLNQVTAGGNVSITAPQSILNAGTSSTQIITSANLTLLAGSGSLGSSTSPLTFQIGGTLLSASAGQDAYLKAVGGDMNIGLVFAGNTASLNAVDGGIHTTLSGLAVVGDSIVLNARDSVGSSTSALQLQVGAGTLSGSIGGSAWILSPGASNALAVGDLSATTGLTVTADGDLTAQRLASSAGAVTASAGDDANIVAVNSSISTAASGSVSLTAVGDLTVGSAATTPGAITLLAGGLAKVTGLVSSGSGNIGVTGNSIDIAAGGSLVSSTGRINLQATGDVFIDKIQTGNATASAITIATTTGRVLEASSDAAADIVANNAGAVVTITAPGGIGNATRTGATTVDTATPNAIETQIASLTATSTGGGIYVAEADGLVVGNVVASGLLQLSAGGALTGTKLQSTAGSVNASAVSASLTTLAAATDISLTTTTGSLAVTGSAIAGRDVALTGKTDVTTATVTGARNATLIAQGGDINAASTTATTGNVAMTASSDVTAATTGAGTDISMTATTGNVGVTTSAIASRDVILNGGANVTTATVTGTRNVSMTAGGAMNAASTTALNGTLTATTTGGLMTLGTANAETQMTLQGQTGIMAGTLTTDTGSISATAVTGDLALTTTDAANAVSLVATANNVKVDIVEAQNGLSITAGQAIGGKSASRYTRIESLGGDVVMGAGSDIVGDLTRAAGNVQMIASNNIDATTTTATTGNAAMTGGASVTAASTSAGTDISMTATAGNVGVTTSATAGRDVTLAGGTNITSATVTGARNVAMTAGGAINAATTRATGGTLTATTQTGTMQLGSARSSGLMTLDSKQALTANSLTTDTGTLNALARTQDLAATTTTSGGAATLTATAGSVKVDTVQAQNDIAVTAGQAIGGKAAARYVSIESLGGNVTLNAGTDVTGNLTRAASNAQMTASNSIDATTTQATAGNVAMTGGANVTAATTSAGTDISMIATAGDVGVTTSAAAGRDVALTAGTNITTATVTGGRNVNMTAQGGDINSNLTAATTGSVTMAADSDVTATSITAGQNIAMTAATGDVTLTTAVATGGTLGLTAGHDVIVLASATSGGDMTLEAQRNLKMIAPALLQSTGGNITGNAVTGDVDVNAATAAGSITFTAGGNVHFGTAGAGQNVSFTALNGDINAVSTTATTGNVAMTASSNVTATTTTAGQNLAMTATTGDVTATTATATGGTLGLTAGRDAIVLASATSGGDMTLEAQRNLKMLSPAVLRSTGANITGNAVTGDVDVNAATAAGNVAFTAGGSVRFGTASAGQNVSFTAATGDVNATTTSAGGTLNVVAANDIVLGTATTGGDQMLTAGSDLTAGTLISTGGSITGTATAGNVTLGTATAQLNATFVAGDALTATDITANVGDATVHTINDITIDTFKAGNDALLDTLSGSMNVTHIVGDGVLLLAKSDIVAPDLKVGRRLVLTSNTVNAGVTHTRSDNFLQATLIGRNQPIMSSVIMTLTSQIGVEFSRFWAQDARLNVLNGVLQLDDGYIGNRMLANNPLTSVLMDNTSPYVQNPYDAQLYTAIKTFWMYMDRSIVRVRGADIIHRDTIDHTVLSESTGLDSSVTETSVADVTKAGRIVIPGLGVLLQPSGELVSFTGNPVMLQGLELPPQQSNEDEKPK